MLCFLAPLAMVRFDEVRLEKLDLSAVFQEWGTPMRDKSVDGHKLSVGGVEYPEGLGTHANGRFEISLGGQAARLTAGAGVDDEATSNASITFEVWVDGRRLAESGLMRKGNAEHMFDVDLAGAKTLVLVVTDGGDGNDNDHADWIAPTVTTLPGGARAVRALVPPPEKAPDIHHGFRARPQINGPRVVGCTEGRDFLFKIPATGVGPLTYSATGVPDGLSLDPATGIITGRMSGPPVAKLQVTVRGPKGTDSRELTIDGRGVLALTPPMGWNSWNVWAGAVNQDRVKAAAQEFVKTGLEAAGYSYVNIDDTWEGKRDASGEITTNDKFPDMAGLARQVHAMGLHLGIYSGPGPETCGGYPASYQHEAQDADTYAKWGIDYLKYDWCSYGSLFPHPTLAELQHPYSLMHDDLLHSGRDIVFSLCQYGMGDVWNWGASVGGNLWRCTGDISDTWSSMSGIAFQGDKWAAGAGPGHWNDPDMLVVGRLGWGDHPRPTRLTPNEQMTHITMWALLAAPLLIGCDLDHLDAFTLDLLTNHDVIDVDQDELGKPATRIVVSGDVEVWARPLADGRTAVGVFNRGSEVQQVTVKFAAFGLSGKLDVRDLWRQKDLGLKDDGFTVSIARHGAALMSLR